MRSQWDLLPRRNDTDVLSRRWTWPGAVAAVMVVAVAVVAAVAGTTAPIDGAAGPGEVALAEAGAQGDAADAVTDDGATAEHGAAPSGAGGVEADAKADNGGGDGARPAPVAGPTQPGQPPTPAGEPPKADDIPGEWIVELQAGESAEQVAEEHEASEGAEVNHVYTAAVDGYSASMSDEEAQRVADDPRVVSVTRDRMVYTAAQTLPTGIKRIGAPTTALGAAVAADVAVLDTGISAHSDLTISGGRNCNGWGSSYADGNGHGTHVAGTIGAKHDTNGVVGVAPGVRLWAGRVLSNSGSGSWSNVICGIDWARQHGGIEVINMSLSGSGTAGSSCGSSTLRQAICNARNAGITIVVAAGNESSNASGSVPAAFPEVVTVSALADFNGLPGGGASATCRSDVDDTFANFSNYGSPVDIIAPGVCILSTSRSGGFTTMSGTSMAAPHVAGAAALYKAANPGATPTQVQNHLTSSGNLDWNNGDDRDSIKEPLLQVGPLSTSGGSDPTTTTTTATSSTSTSSTSSTTSSTTTMTTAPSGNITLTLARKGSSSTVGLFWSGASGSNVDIWRGTSSTNLTKVLTTANDDGENINSGRGTWYFQVCNAGTTTCSAVKSITV